jgi:hypothetical protein
MYGKTVIMKRQRYEAMFKANVAPGVVKGVLKMHLKLVSLLSEKWGAP